MTNLTSGLDDDIVDGGDRAALLRLCPSSRTIRFPAATRRGSICFLDQGLSPAASSPDYMTSSHDMAAKPATARISRSQEKWVLAATIIASGMAFIDMTIVNVALPVLQHSLNASFAQAQWVVEAYTLFLSALILTGGSIGDLYGRRRVFGIGIVLFALASATCGLAPDPLTLIMARATQGIGAALMMPGSLAILSASFPPERQGRAIGLWSAATGIGAAIAPALGGWLIDTFSWRWVFLINLPLAAISLAIVFVRVPESRSARQRPLDWIGILLATCGLGGMTYGLIAAGQTGFAHPLTGGILAGGVLFLILFVVAEARIAAPMLSLSLFRLPGFAGVQVFTFLLWAALSGALFFVPFRLQQIQGFKPLEAGMALLPFVVIVSILSRWAGGLSDRFGPRFPLMIGACFAGAGFLLLTLAGPQTSYIIGFMPALMTIGVGMGICVAPVTVAALSAAGEDNVGLASAINNMAARTGGLIAIAVFGLLLADRFDAALTSALAPLNLPDAALQALAAQRAKLAGAEVPADLAPDLQLAVTAAIKLAFVNGYRWIMASAAAMAFVSSVIAATSMAQGKPAARKTMVPQENVG